MSLEIINDKARETRLRTVSLTLRVITAETIVPSDPTTWPLLLRIKQAVQVSGVSLRQIERWLSADKLAVRRNGKTVLIESASLLKAIEGLPRY